MRVELDPQALEDLAYWVKTDRGKALHILKLLREITRSPFSGTGKPEPLRHALQGYWSRRIDPEHRLVYRCDGEVVRVLACRYHYR